MSNEIIKPLTNSFAPELNYFINKIKVKFNTNCLIQDKITYTHGAIVNIHIVYKLSPTLSHFDFTLENYLSKYGLNMIPIKLTKNTDIDKYKFSGYGIGFDAR